jgi:hypothetical protein
MVPVLGKTLVQQGFSRPVSWRGRSGRFYALNPERLEDFVLRGNELYLIARGTLVLWAGSAEEIITDVQSRARFRLALAAADRAFHVQAAEDDVERMTVIWDLEGASPVSGLNAA